MRLGLISARYPYDSHEPFLDAELRALAPWLDALALIPTSPRGAEPSFTGVPGEVVRLPLLGGNTLLLAVRTLARRPWRAAAAIAKLLGARGSWRAKLKNFVVFPKSLAVAEVARVRRLDHLHAYWLSTPATVAWLAARIAGIPFSATAHRWDIYENNVSACKLRDAAFVRAISERGRRDLLALTGGDPARVHVVRVGVELPPLARFPVVHRDEWEPLRREDPLRILCAAALLPVKGHTILLEALALARDSGVAFTCTLAGDGPLREEIAARIDALGLRAQVCLAGKVPHDELLARLARGEYDISVLASVERVGGLMEGVPVALIEAMAAGAVVVATDSGSIGELVDATTGVLVPHSNARALADGLARIAADHDLRDRLRVAARERVEREYDVVTTTARLRLLLSPIVWGPDAKHIETLDIGYPEHEGVHG